MRKQPYLKIRTEKVPFSDGCGIDYWYPYNNIFIPKSTNHSVYLKKYKTNCSMKKTVSLLGSFMVFVICGIIIGCESPPKDAKEEPLMDLDAFGTPQPIVGLFVLTLEKAHKASEYRKRENVRFDIIGNIGLFSPSFWFSNRIFELVAAIDINPNSKFYFLVGSDESDDMVSDQQKMVELLLRKGVSKDNIKNIIIKGGLHNEELWRDNFPEAYQWLIKN